MTRDEIETMESGRELDAIIWFIANNKTIDLSECRYVDGDIQPHAGYPVGHVSPEFYSTYLPAAFNAALNISNRGWSFEVEYDTQEYWCTFHNIKGVLLPVTARAYTAPLAICRAVLLATCWGDE